MESSSGGQEPGAPFGELFGDDIHTSVVLEQACRAAEAGAAAAPAAADKAAREREVEIERERKKHEDYLASSKNNYDRGRYK